MKSKIVIIQSKRVSFLFSWDKFSHLILCLIYRFFFNRYDIFEFMALAP